MRIWWTTNPKTKPQILISFSTTCTTVYVLRQRAIWYCCGNAVWSDANRLSCLILMSINSVWSWQSIRCLVLTRRNTIQYNTIQYDTIRYDTIRYDTIRYDTIPYHTIPYHTIPYHTIPYHTIPYHTIPYHTIPYHTIQYNTIQYNTIQYNTSNKIYLAHTVCKQTYIFIGYIDLKKEERFILTTSLLSSHCLLAVTPIHNIQTDRILLYMWQ